MGAVKLILAILIGLAAVWIVANLIAFWRVCENRWRTASVDVGQEDQQ